MEKRSFGHSLRMLVKVSRPFCWLWSPLPFLIGLLGSASAITPLSAFQLFLLSFPYCILLYGINDIYDYESDRINRRKGSIYGIRLDSAYHPFVKRASLIVVILMMASSIFTFNLINILSMASLLVLSYCYPAPPARLKARSPLDSISNGAIFLFVVLLGFSYGKTVSDMPF